MKSIDLKDIAERDMELLNAISPLKLLAIGRAAGLRAGSRVIDFGCGFGEALALWAEEFGISGVGIDARAGACERARTNITARDLEGRIEIVCMDAAEYEVEPGSFDVAACIGSTFVWDGFPGAVRALRRAVKPGGRLIVGESYWQRAVAPPELDEHQVTANTEADLLRWALAEGCEFEYVVRAGAEDWDRYESDKWRSLLRWIDDNPDHPERQEVIDFLHSSQEEYFGEMRGRLGWAMYVLRPL